MKTRGANKYYWAAHGKFKLRISNHAMRRAKERANLSARKVIDLSRLVAEQCTLWMDGSRRDDVIDVCVDGIIWRVVVHNKRRGTILTMMPSHWKERPYDMRELV